MECIYIYIYIAQILIFCDLPISMKRVHYIDLRSAKTSSPLVLANSIEGECGVGGDLTHATRSHLASRWFSFHS
jgi:hypothetical protein